MPNYRVMLVSGLSSVVEVEADDEIDALDKVYDADGMPSGICAQCSGWGQSWSMDGGEEWEPESVLTEDGTVLWEQTPVVSPEERVRRAEAELEAARSALAAAEKSSN